MKYYEPKHFLPQEYVPPDVFDELGDRSLLVMDDRVLRTDDALRDFFGRPMVINNWHVNGTRKYSGFRTHGCGVGAVRGQHYFGRASDKIISGIDINIVRKAIIDNRKNFPYITVIEDEVSWLHTDCRCISGDEIQLIKP